MIKKRKKQSKYIFRNKEFTTFKNMKTYAYFNMDIGTEEEMKKKVIYFMSIDKAKFRNPVRPGDRLDYELEVVKMKSTLMTLVGKAYVDGKLTAEAELKAMIVDK